MVQCSGHIANLIIHVVNMQEQILKNLTKVLDHAGSDWDHVFKVNIFLKKMEDFDAINAVYTSALPEDKPARTCVQAG